MTPKTPEENEEQKIHQTMAKLQRALASEGKQRINAMRDAKACLGAFLADLDQENETGIADYNAGEFYK